MKNNLSKYFIYFSIVYFFTSCNRKQEYGKEDSIYSDNEFLKNPANTDLILYKLFENPEIYEQVKDCTWVPYGNPLEQCETIKKNILYFASEEGKLTLYSSRLYRNKHMRHITDSLLQSSFGIEGHPMRKDAFYFYCVIPTMDSLIAVKYGSYNAKDSIIDWVINKAEQISNVTKKGNATKE